MKTTSVRLIPLAEFENQKLRDVKETRSVAEYCWTCTAPLIEYVMQRETEAASVAYLDADLFFFSDPRPIYEEFEKGSILIIGHRYSPEYQAWEKTSGIYNVSMIIFRNDSSGIECLRWWKDQCMTACVLDPDAGYCGDQKYLDDWPARFRDVIVLRHKGGGLAPWNIAKYSLKKREGRTFVDEEPLIFYHFHSLQIIARRLFFRRLFAASKGYRFNKRQRALIYDPYAESIHRAIIAVEQASPGFAWGYTGASWLDVLEVWRSGNLVKN